MNRPTIALCSMLVAGPVLLAGCGSSNNAPAAAIAAKPDAIITFDGARHTCVVALSGEAQGSMVACADLIPFMRDELRLAKGSIYDTRTTGTPDAAQVARTTQNLKDSGYRFIGGH